MEIPVGGNSFGQDRPGTRMRLVLRPENEALPGRVRGVFTWALKLLVALTAGVVCVAIASYAPVGGRAIGGFVPARCSLLIQVPSGAALHRALLASPAFTDLLDDADVAAWVEALMKSAPAATVDAAGNDLPEAEPRSLRAQFDAAYAKLPWPVSAFIPPTAAGIYPFVGGECVVALTRIEAPASQAGAPSLNDRGRDGVLIFTRLSGSRGHLASLASAFAPVSRKLEVFNLGGGLLAIGINGARPEFEPHAPPMVVSSHTILTLQPAGDGLPLLRISFSPKPVSAAAAAPEAPLDLNNETLGRLFEEDIPESVLRALVKPPTVGDMLNWKAPPAVARLELFAAPDGHFFARGRMEGEVPALPTHALAPPDAPRGPRRDEAFAEFPSGGPMAEFVVPIDLRACFLRHVESGMKLVNGAQGLTKGQRLWTSRFRVLADDRVDLDASFWPALGHVAIVEIHEAKKDEDATAMGTIKAWLPCDVKSPETYFAAADLARARWDYLFDSADRVTVKTQFVKRFRAESETPDAQDDRFVLATGKINAPAWSIGPKGFRVTTDAGAFALIRGPQESDFIAPPANLDAYRVRLDGPRLASTVESLVTLYYDELEFDLGSQKFLTQHPDSKLIIRLANTCAVLLGKLAFEIVPDSTGAELRLSWRPATRSAAAAPASGAKKDAKKSDDDDAPPPPPSN